MTDNLDKDPMKTMLLQVLFSNWLKLLNEGNYDELRTSIAKAITAMEKKNRSVDVYVCGCEFPTAMGYERHYEMRCPNCTASGGRFEDIHTDNDTGET